MNLADLNRLRSETKHLRTVDTQDIPGAERTLLLGYTCDRDTWHVYVRGAYLHVLVYNHVTRVVVRYEKHFHWQAADLVPDKRVYPESTDLEFARLLTSHGVDLQFASFDTARFDRLARKPFHGAIYDSATRGLVDVEGGSL
ncbi:hypothetical protein ACFC5T_17175 [Streptomyces sp. NPDC055961]|uniref:hypothetical protein n=1 Tax=Streptomyces sp. NPDC055961 TaxID=3345666 RepID=UPI0035D5A3F6